MMLGIKIKNDNNCLDKLSDNGLLTKLAYESVLRVSPPLVINKN